MPFDANSFDSNLTRIFDRLGTFENQIAALTKQVEKTNGRIGRLEIWRSAVVGGLTVLVIIVGWYIAIRDNPPPSRVREYARESYIEGGSNDPETPPKVLSRLRAE